MRTDFQLQQALVVANAMASAQAANRHSYSDRSQMSLEVPQSAKANENDMDNLTGSCLNPPSTSLGNQGAGA